MVNSRGNESAASFLTKISVPCRRSETPNSMATDFKFIPVIDVTALVAKCDDPGAAGDAGFCDVVKQLDKACREAGFFYATGHGIPDSLIREVRSVTHGYFDLPYDEKTKIKMSPSTGYRGYQRVGENITKGIPDIHEAIDCYREVTPGMYGALGEPMEGINLWPSNPSNFKSLMVEYVSLCADLSRKIMRGIALALGCPRDAFEGSIGGDPFWVMRLIGYPGISKANGHKPENDIGCGAHTDYGLLTLVNQDDDITALQRNIGTWLVTLSILPSLAQIFPSLFMLLENFLLTPVRIIFRPPFGLCIILRKILDRDYSIGLNGGSKAQNQEILLTAEWPKPRCRLEDQPLCTMTRANVVNGAASRGQNTVLAKGFGLLSVEGKGWLREGR
uniref:Non-haem dioxygenase N-terminal domain-containing protein n=1 Tax=Kalanchoe fedtschenkoi TaxID=63787 RepID=A0A7N0VJW1_KALFE